MYYNVISLVMFDSSSGTAGQVLFSSSGRQELDSFFDVFQQSPCKHI